MRKLPHPPLIAPEETPGAIIAKVLSVHDYGEDALQHSAPYQSIIKHLSLYQRAGDNRRWEDYRNKIEPEILEQLAKILRECRRNGFVGPYVYEGRLFWKRIMTTSGIRADLCTLCERECKRRELVTAGWYKQNNIEEAKRCWDA